MCKLIIFDLDDTLLRRDKTISPYTIGVLQKCRERGILLGVATARSALNASRYISELAPDVIISSGGALGVLRGEVITYRGFSEAETAAIIHAALGSRREITIDAIGGHYVSYAEKNELTCPWSETINMREYRGDALKICVETADGNVAQRIADEANGSVCTKFSGSDWYMLTKAGVGKESAIRDMLESLSLSAADIVAFGDDYSDIGMLKYCGCGVAMANAQEAVKAVAADIAGDCDDDGAARYIEEKIL